MFNPLIYIGNLGKQIFYPSNWIKFYVFTSAILSTAFAGDSYTRGCSNGYDAKTFEVAPFSCNTQRGTAIVAPENDFITEKASCLISTEYTGKKGVDLRIVSEGLECQIGNDACSLGVKTLKLIPEKPIDLTLLSTNTTFFRKRPFISITSFGCDYHEKECDDSPDVKISCQ